MKILLIDHHRLFREGLRDMLRHLRNEAIEILEASSLSTGLKLAEQRPNLILLEIFAHECAGTSALKTLRQHYPFIPIVVVSSEENPVVINQAMGCGASGYVCKSASATTLLGAINLVLTDSIYLPMQLMPHVKVMKNQLSPENRVNNSNRNEYSLTKRQMHILGYLTEGLSNKEISHTVNLSEGTVKVHIASIFQALRVNRRARAAQVARELGLV